MMEYIFENRADRLRELIGSGLKHSDPKGSDSSLAQGNESTGRLAIRSDVSKRLLNHMSAHCFSVRPRVSCGGTAKAWHTPDFYQGQVCVFCGFNDQCKNFVMKPNSPNYHNIRLNEEQLAHARALASLLERTNGRNSERFAGHVRPSFTPAGVDKGVTAMLGRVIDGAMQNNIQYKAMAAAGAFNRNASRSSQNTESWTSQWDGTPSHETITAAKAFSGNASTPWNQAWTEPRPVIQQALSVARSDLWRSPTSTWSTHSNQASKGKGKGEAAASSDAEREALPGQIAGPSADRP